MKHLRQAVIARRGIASNIAQSLLPLEESADVTAAQALRCVADLLDERRAAALAVTEGADILAVMQEGCNLAFQAQAKFREAHQLLADRSKEMGMDPVCPPNTGENPLKIVG